jgi:hypothetical protein
MRLGIVSWWVSQFICVAYNVLNGISNPRVSHGHICPDQPRNRFASDIEWLTNIDQPENDWGSGTFLPSILNTECNDKIRLHNPAK